MLDILLDTVLDALKMLPFLFGAYLLIEYIEQRAFHQFESILSKWGRFGPVAGALLGCFPQCGFSVASANLYSKKIITTGTLIAVFLSTSDEAIPVLLMNPKSFGAIVGLIAAKIVIAILFGMIADLLFDSKNGDSNRLTVPSHRKEHGECECGCEHHGGILKEALLHTLNIFLFILMVLLVMNLLIAWIGEDNLAKLLITNSPFQPAIAALIGFIPNCAATVVLSELFLAGNLSFGSLIAGLCTGAGMGLVVLFKSNRDRKKNLKIVGYLYLVSVLAGTLLQFIR